MMMMNKGLGLMDDSISISNLTSTLSGETSISSNANTATNAALLYPQPPPTKKKRNLPGHPDPDAEVIALSPKSLMATNRFLCEICNKGFQRDQNLQLHRRGHNLPWKLKQRAKDQIIRKKVYVCPEPSCVHHDPVRALGDLTGIKKHFCRKHGEKKWKCEKCSKKYAVQSDWKAHSKICGTREYRCDCGTLFSRRDSFITHRAFCDALAEESARGINPLTLPSLPTTTAVAAAGGGGPNSTTLPHHLSLHHQQQILHSLPMKREQPDHHHHHQSTTSFTMRPEIPPWLACPPPPPTQQSLNLQPGAGAALDVHNLFSFQHYNQSPGGPTLSSTSFQAPPPPQMSATALLQKAAEMGVTVSNNHHQQLIEGGGGTGESSSSSSMLHEMMMMSSNMQSTTGFDVGFGAFHQHHHHQGMQQGAKGQLVSGGSSGGGGGDGMTRDFLGLRTFSHKDFLSMAGLNGHINSSTSSASFDHQTTQNPW